jgi:hypothetical protein
MDLFIDLQSQLCRRLHAREEIYRPEKPDLIARQRANLPCFVRLLTLALIPGYRLTGEVHRFQDIAPKAQEL